MYFESFFLVKAESSLLGATKIMFSSLITENDFRIIAEISVNVIVMLQQYIARIEVGYFNLSQQLKKILFSLLCIWCHLICMQLSLNYDKKRGNKWNCQSHMLSSTAFNNIPE